MAVILGNVSGGLAVHDFDLGDAYHAWAASHADEAALKRAIVACRAEARGRRIRLLSRRRYVNNCVTKAMKDRPNMHIQTLLKEHPNLTDLPVENWPGF